MTFSYRYLWALSFSTAAYFEMMVTDFLYRGPTAFEHWGFFFRQHLDFLGILRSLTKRRIVLKYEIFVPIYFLANVFLFRTFVFRAFDVGLWDICWRHGFWNAIFIWNDSLGVIDYFLYISFNVGRGDRFSINASHYRHRSQLFGRLWVRFPLPTG